MRTIMTAGTSATLKRVNKLADDLNLDTRNLDSNDINDLMDILRLMDNGEVKVYEC